MAIQCGTIKDGCVTNIYKIFYSGLGLLLLVMLVGRNVAAQPVTIPEQIALGGGVAFTSGSSSHFYNPANLMIRTGSRSTQITLGMGGL
ncbi:MAG: hypothetical protein WD097_05620, partial [Balneolales bacterium]